MRPKAAADQDVRVCACCNAASAVFQRNGDWRCPCGARGTTIHKTVGRGRRRKTIETIVVTRSIKSLNSPQPSAGTGHLSPKELLERGLLPDGKGARLTIDEIQRRARARRQADAIMKANRRLARAKERA